MYTRRTSCKNGRDSLAYCEGAFDDMWHHEGDRLVLHGEVNMLPDDIVSYGDQMAQYWDHENNPRHLTETSRTVISFARDEINGSGHINDDGEYEFDDPNAPELALSYAKGFASFYYPDRQSVVYIELSKDGILHAHVITNDWAMSDGHGLSNEKVTYINSKGKEITTDKTKARALAYACDEYMKKNGLSLTVDNDLHLENMEKSYMEQVQEDIVAESQFDRVLREGNTEDRTYKGYIADCIREASSSASNMQEYEQMLAQKGITYEQKTSKKYGDYLKYAVSPDFADGNFVIPKSSRLSHLSIGSEKLSLSMEMDVSYEGIQKVISKHVSAQEHAHKSTQKSETYTVMNTELTAEEHQGFEDMMEEVSAEQPVEIEIPPERTEFDRKFDAFKRHTTQQAGNLQGLTMSNAIRAVTPTEQGRHYISEVQEKLQKAATTESIQSEQTTPVLNTQAEPVSVEAPQGQSRRRRHDGKAEAAAKAKAAREQAEQAKKDEIAAKLAAEKAEREARDAKIASQIDMFDDAFGDVTAEQLKEAGKFAVAPDITHKSLGES